MKNRILEKLNNLQPKEYLINFPQKNETIWSLGFFHEDLIIKFASVAGQPDLISFTFEKDRNVLKEEISFVFNETELTPFLTNLRKLVASKFGIRTCDEEKRTELIDLMKQANNISLGIKEQLVIIDDNEKKTYFFRNTHLYKEYSTKELSKIDFYTFSISEMLKDKRLNETVPTIKQYEIMISNSEFCEIFNVDLENDKQLLFAKSFTNMFPEVEKSVTPTMNTGSVNNPVEQLDSQQTVTNKIKKIL